MNLSASPVSMRVGTLQAPAASPAASRAPSCRRSARFTVSCSAKPAVLLMRYGYLQGGGVSRRP